MALENAQKSSEKISHGNISLTSELDLDKIIDSMKEEIKEKDQSILMCNNKLVPSLLNPS